MAESVAREQRRFGGRKPEVKKARTGSTVPAPPANHTAELGDRKPGKKLSKSKGLEKPPRMSKQPLQCKECKKPIELNDFYRRLLDSGKRNVFCSECHTLHRALQSDEPQQANGVHECEPDECPHKEKCHQSTHYHRIARPKTGAARRLAEEKGSDKTKPKFIRAKLCTSSIDTCVDASCHHHRLRKERKPVAPPVFELVDDSEDEATELLGTTLDKRGNTVEIHAPKILRVIEEKKASSSSPAMDQMGVHQPKSEDAEIEPRPTGGEIPMLEASSGSDEDGSSEGETTEETGEPERGITRESSTKASSSPRPEEASPKPNPTYSPYELRLRIIPVMFKDMVGHASLIATRLSKGEHVPREDYQTKEQIRRACVQAITEMKQEEIPLPNAEYIITMSRGDVSDGEISEGANLRSRLAAMRADLGADHSASEQSVNSETNTPSDGEMKALPDEWWTRGASAWRARGLKYGEKWLSRAPPVVDMKEDFGILGRHDLKGVATRALPTREVSILFKGGFDDLRPWIYKWLTKLPFVNDYNLMPIESADSTTMTRANTTVLQSANLRGLYLGFQTTGVPNAYTLRDQAIELHQYLKRFEYGSVRKCEIFTDLYKKLCVSPGVSNITVLSLQDGSPMKTAMASLSNVCQQADVKEYREASVDIYDNTIMYLYQQKLLTEAKYLDATPLRVGVRPANESSGPPSQ